MQSEPFLSAHSLGLWCWGKKSHLQLLRNDSWEWLLKIQNNESWSENREQEKLMKNWWTNDEYLIVSATLLVDYIVSWFQGSKLLRNLSGKQNEKEPKGDNTKLLTNEERLKWFKTI